MDKKAEIRFTVTYEGLTLPIRIANPDIIIKKVTEMISNKFIEHGKVIDESHILRLANTDLYVVRPNGKLSELALNTYEVEHFEFYKLSNFKAFMMKLIRIKNIIGCDLPGWTSTFASHEYWKSSVWFLCFVDVRLRSLESGHLGLLLILGQKVILLSLQPQLILSH